jgi:hypothetical protein
MDGDREMVSRLLLVAMANQKRFVGGAHGGVITLRLECAQDMQRESAAWVCAARKRRDRHDDVDTSLVPSLLRKQIDVEITAGKVL